jgi:hypothetical protein
VGLWRSPSSLARVATGGAEALGPSREWARRGKASAWMSRVIRARCGSPPLSGGGYSGHRACPGIQASEQSCGVAGALKMGHHGVDLENGAVEQEPVAGP